jgi:hypothetical protein
MTPLDPPSPRPAQIHPIMRTYDLMGIIDGSEPCPPKMIINEKGQEIVNP